MLRGGMEMLGPEVHLRYSLLISEKKESVLKVCPKYVNENVYARSNGDLLLFCHMISLYLHTNFPVTVKIL